MKSWQLEGREAGRLKLGQLSITLQPLDSRHTDLTLLLDQLGFSEDIRCRADRLEPDSRLLRNIQQGMAAVRIVQDPEHRKLVGPYLVVEASFAQLGLAVWRQVGIDRIAFESLQDIGENGIAFSQGVGPNEIEVVGRRVIFGILAVRRSRKSSDRQIETGGQYWRSSYP